MLNINEVVVGSMLFYDSSDYLFVLCVHFAGGGGGGNLQNKVQLLTIFGGNERFTATSSSLGGHQNNIDCEEKNCSAAN